mmetsp:Transcript_544/g.706  ORF Transcript_544/g.706 Transcript_544/m.706 type:complete len:246 (-) Transcript_544:2398-3135(-)
MRSDLLLNSLLRESKELNSAWHLSIIEAVLPNSVFNWALSISTSLNCSSRPREYADILVWLQFTCSCKIAARSSACSLCRTSDASCSSASSLRFSALCKESNSWHKASRWRLEYPNSLSTQFKSLSLSSCSLRALFLNWTSLSAEATFSVRRVSWLLRLMFSSLSLLKVPNSRLASLSSSSFSLRDLDSLMILFIWDFIKEFCDTSDLGDSNDLFEIAGDSCSILLLCSSTRSSRDRNAAQSSVI